MSDTTTAPDLKRIVDVARHVSHDARELAEDAIADGIHAARRAVKSVRRGVGDVRDDAVDAVKRRPLTAVAATAGAGFIVGLAVGWIARRATARGE